MKPEKITFKTRLILINNYSTLLIGQTRINGGQYTLIGGNVDAGETATQSLVRECYEEAGLIIREEHLKLVHVRQKIKGKSHKVTLYFQGLKWEGNIRPKEKDKFTSVAWYPIDQLPLNIKPTTKQVLQAINKGQLFATARQTINI
ncbi:MAG: NUDIX hydrolase [Bacteroidota bacterium]